MTEATEATTDYFERAMSFLNEQWGLAAPAESSHPGDIDFTLKAATSGRWRRTSMDEGSLADAAMKISSALASSRPLEFSVPFGGYKSSRIHSCPHLEWAEVFCLNFLRRYGAFVKSTYPYSVTITFSYCSSVMDIVNNMPLSWQEIYIREFQQLTELFSDDQVTFQVFDIGRLIGNPQTIRDAVLESFERVRSQWPSLDPATVKKRLASASRNLVLNGVKDLSASDQGELDARVENSAMLCEALDSLPERREFNKFSSRIQLVNVRGPVPAIHVASCDTSSNHFGVGMGVVEVRRDRCLQRIVTDATEIAHLHESPEANFDLASETSRGFAGLRSGNLVAI